MNRNKAIKLLTFMLIICLIIAGYKYGNQNNFPVLLTLGMFFFIFLAYANFELNDMGTKEIALIASLSSFAAVTRVPFASIPNVQPTTFLVALSGLVFGPYEGFLVGASSAFISNIFLGQGPWTPWQMFAWGIVGAISGIISIRGFKPKVEIFAVICFFYGFLFDWIMNLWHVIGFIRPINAKTIFVAYLTGLTMDVMHAVGNFVFAMVFYESFYKVLFRFKRRMKVEYFRSNKLNEQKN